ncbi:MAG TPA: hypothetical protein VFM69_11275 [Pricia sp.]|nr:hypothetical protein [Pricia sp.]
MIRIIFSFGIVVVLSSLKPLLDNPSSPYIQYSSIIQEGESYILDNELSKALKSYDKALHLIEKPLASDCFTALQVAAYLKKFEKFSKFLEKGFATGLVPKDLRKDSLLSSFVKQNKLEDIVQGTYSEYEKMYSQNINEFLSDTISKISLYDNKWKVFYLDSLRSLNKNKNPNKAEFYDKKYDSIVTQLVEEKLIPLISRYGYPGERQIGIQRVWLKSEPYDYSFVNNSTLFVLLHYYRKPKGCKYNTLLYEEMKKGNLRPEHYARIMDYQVKYGDNKCTVLPYYEWGDISDTANIEKINSRRAKIGLGKFQLIKKKYERGMDICYETDKGNYKHIKLFYWCG